MAVLVERGGNEARVCTSALCNGWRGGGAGELGGSRVAMSFTVIHKYEGSKLCRIL